MSPQADGSSRRGRRTRAVRSFAAWCEALEPRVVLTTTTALDPTFGVGGVVRGAVVPGDINLSGATAVAVQADGKIIEVVQTGQCFFGATANPGVAVRRLNADGTTDLAFGTNGQVVIPNASFGNQFSQAPRNVVVAPDGSIVFAAVAQQGTGSFQQGSADQSVVVRLTPAGQLDPTSGTGGEYVVNMDAGTMTNVAVPADGMIVAAGFTEISPVMGFAPTFSVVRLTTAGASDTTFNATGYAATTMQVAALSSSPPSNGSVTSLAVTPGGQILVGGNAGDANFSALTSKSNATLAEFGADGTLNTSFGTAGKVGLTIAQSGSLDASEVQPDGSIIVAGTTTLPSNDYEYGTTTLVRLTAAGVIDPSFPMVGPVAPSGAIPTGDHVNSIALDADGRIILGGTARIGMPVTTSPDSYPFTARYRATGAIDTTFGINGLARLTINATYPTGAAGFAQPDLNALALTAAGRVLAVGSIFAFTRDASITSEGGYAGNQGFLARVLPIRTTAEADDYDSDGRADPALYLADLGILAYRPSSGGPDFSAQFGIPGAGQSIPMPGDYDGDGRTDLAVFLPAIAYAAYRPAADGADVLEQFGISGPGQTVPAASIPAAFGTATSGSGPVTAAAVAVHDLALTDDLITPELAQLRRQRKATI